MEGVVFFYKMFDDRNCRISFVLDNCVLPFNTLREMEGVVIVDKIYHGCNDRNLMYLIVQSAHLSHSRGWKRLSSSTK